MITMDYYKKVMGDMSELISIQQKQYLSNWLNSNSNLDSCPEFSALKGILRNYRDMQTAISSLANLIETQHPVFSSEVDAITLNLAPLLNETRKNIPTPLVDQIRCIIYSNIPFWIPEYLNGTLPDYFDSINYVELTRDILSAKAQEILACGNYPMDPFASTPPFHTPANAYEVYLRYDCLLQILMALSSPSEVRTETEPPDSIDFGRYYANKRYESIHSRTKWPHRLECQFILCETERGGNYRHIPTDLSERDAFYYEMCSGTSFTFEIVAKFMELQDSQMTTMDLNDPIVSSWCMCAFDVFIALLGTYSKFLTNCPLLFWRSEVIRQIFHEIFVRLPYERVLTTAELKIYGLQNAPNEDWVKWYPRANYYFRNRLAENFFAIHSSGTVFPGDASHEVFSVLQDIAKKDPTFLTPHPLKNIDPALCQTIYRGFQIHSHLYPLALRHEQEAHYIMSSLDDDSNIMPREVYQSMRHHADQQLAQLCELFSSQEEYLRVARCHEASIQFSAEIANNFCFRMANKRFFSMIAASAYRYSGYIFYAFRCKVDLHYCSPKEESDLISLTQQIYMEIAKSSEFQPTYDVTQHLAKLLSLLVPRLYEHCQRSNLTRCILTPPALEETATSIYNEIPKPLHNDYTLTEDIIRTQLHEELSQIEKDYTRLINGTILSRGNGVLRYCNLKHLGMGKLICDAEESAKVYELDCMWKSQKKAAKNKVKRTHKYRDTSTHQQATSRAVDDAKRAFLKTHNLTALPQTRFRKSYFTYFERVHRALYPDCFLDYQQGISRKSSAPAHSADNHQK